MQRHEQKTSRYAHLARLLLIAFSVSVFCAPPTLADSRTHTYLFDIMHGYIRWIHITGKPNHYDAYKGVNNNAKSERQCRRRL